MSKLKEMHEKDFLFLNQCRSQRLNQRANQK